MEAYRLKAKPKPDGAQRHFFHIYTQTYPLKASFSYLNYNITKSIQVRIFMP